MKFPCFFGGWNRVEKNEEENGMALWIAMFNLCIVSKWPLSTFKTNQDEMKNEPFTEIAYCTSSHQIQLLKSPKWNAKMFREILYSIRKRKEIAQNFSLHYISTFT